MVNVSLPYSNYYGLGPGQMGPAAQMPNEYGYGLGPGQSNRGYYEQRTPVGSFGAAEQQFSQGAGPVGVNQAFNPYIGQQTPGIGPAAGVLGYGQQAANYATSGNPYLGGTTRQASAATNPFAGQDNPYTSAAINNASQDAIRNYQTFTAPQRDRQAAMSGSFGNAGVQQMQLEDQRNLQGTLGNIATNARMQDYRDQAQMGEAAANRQTGVSQFNSGLNAADLGRNLGGWLSGQGLGLQGLGMQLGAAQFDSSMGQRGNEFNANMYSNDLGRNANLAQNLGQFNAGAMNNMGQFNANLGQQNNQFNAGQGNAVNMYNAGAANQMLGQARNLNQQQNQFDQNMDFNTWQANNQNMRTGFRDQLDFLNQMMGWQGQGIGAANNIQNTPLQYWQQFANAANAAGGMGGSQNQNLQGNPILGGLGGWQLFSRLFPNGFGG